MLCKSCGVELYITFFFFFNDTATTEIYTLSLHDALPISRLQARPQVRFLARLPASPPSPRWSRSGASTAGITRAAMRDRKSTRLNSSHANISYAVFCLKKKNKTLTKIAICNQQHITQSNK